MVQGVGAVRHDHAPRPMCEGFSTRQRHLVPVLWANVIGEHVPKFGRGQPCEAAQLWNIRTELFRLKGSRDRARGVIHLRSDRPPSVDDVDVGEALFVGAGRRGVGGDLRLGRLKDVETQDAIHTVADVVPVDELQRDVLGGRSRKDPALEHRWTAFGLQFNAHAVPLVGVHGTSKASTSMKRSLVVPGAGLEPATFGCLRHRRLVRS